MTDPFTRWTCVRCFEPRESRAGWEPWWFPEDDVVKRCMRRVGIKDPDRTCFDCWIRAIRERKAA